MRRTNTNIRDDEPQQITLLEAEVAVDLLLRFRTATGDGDETIANKITTAAARKLGISNQAVTKSNIYNWRHGLSLPQSAHLVALRCFFESSRFRKAVPEVENLWNPLEATIKLGCWLRSWHGYVSTGSTRALDGYWLLYVPRFGYRRKPPMFILRAESVSGYSFGVAHGLPTVENKSGWHAGPWSGFIFSTADGFSLHLRSRIHRGKHAISYLNCYGSGMTVKQCTMHHLDSPRRVTGSTAFDCRPWALNRVAQESIAAQSRNFFDTNLWSVLPQ